MRITKIEFSNFFKA